MFISHLLVTFSIAVSVENFFLKPNCWEASIALFSKCWSNCIDTSFSKILATAERTKIGLSLLHSVLLPHLYNGEITGVFKSFGKIPVLIDWLKYDLKLEQ